MPDDTDAIDRAISDWLKTPGHAWPSRRCSDWGSEFNPVTGVRTRLIVLRNTKYPIDLLAIYSYDEATGAVRYEEETTAGWAACEREEYDE